VEVTVPGYETDLPELVPVLSRGKHRNPRRGACFMELASYLAGERWSDQPACFWTATASPRPRSRTLEEPQIETGKYQNNSDIHCQPCPELVPEEQNIHANHNGYQREHV
jgi:hypothetical protein